MGAIADCIRAGIPREILLPILPSDKSFSGKGHGKAPAMFDPSTNSWGALLEWQRGGLDPATILRDADTAGGNAGILLGAPFDGFQFLAVDIDLDDTPLAVKWRNGVVAALQNVWNQPLLVRETWTYRALLLVSIPVDAHPGAKKVFTISYSDPKVPSPAVKIGKIEILAHGQQCVVAGTHISGNAIQWYREDGSGQAAPRTVAPMVLETMPRFSAFDEVVTSVVQLLDGMSQIGFSYTALSATAGNGIALPLDELGAPSAIELASLLDSMPNPTEVDRDIYISVLHSVAGARAGLEAARGALTMQEDTLITHAVASWASRWVPPPGGKASTYDEEVAKWQADIARPRDERFAGWRHLLLHAQSFGAPESVLRAIAMEKAQDQFKADTTTKAPPDHAGNTALTPDAITFRQSVNPALAVTSDVACAERFLGFFAGNAVWVPASGSWLLWAGNAGWKSEEVSASTMTRWVIDRMYWYIGVYGSPNQAQGQAGWSMGTHDKMLSAGKINKVTEILKANLAKGTGDINKGYLMLQTPNSLYDLTTTDKITEAQRRKSFLETRSTSVEPWPDMKACPLFDKLVMGLCDGNADVYEWFMHYIGYCMLGAPGEAVFVVVWGSGKNGKSTLVRVLQGLFGDYAVALDAQVIQESGRNLHPASLNRLRGKRLAMISELDKEARWNMRTLKMITGGDDIEARDMNKNPTPFRSQAGLIVLANDKPPIERADPAIQRRFRLIETVIQRPDSEKITNMDLMILKDEGPAALRKIMQYAKLVHQNGLPALPPSMKAAAVDTLSETDTIYGWLQEDCEYGTAAVAEHEESIEELRKRCELYISRIAKESGGGGGFVADKLSPKEFLARLRREGISLEDPAKPDGAGRPLRHRRKGPNGDTIYMAKGIRIKGLRVVPETPRKGSAVA